MYFSSIQSLRFIAAAVVVHYHIYLISEVEGFRFGYYGVDIFFVISGFIIAYIGSEVSKTKFFLSRLIRIIPLYYALTIILFTFSLYFPDYLNNTKNSSIQDLIKSLLFIPYEKSLNQIQPILMIGWTLNYEMFFYAIYGFSLFFKGRINHNLLTSFIILFIFFIFNIFNFDVISKFYGSYHLLEFLTGIVLYEIYKKNFINNFFADKYIVLVLLSLLSTFEIFSLRVDTSYIKIILFLVPSALLVFLFIKNSNLPFYNGVINKIFNDLGDQSYSLYLSHFFVIKFIYIINLKFFDFSFLIYYFISFISSIICASIIHFLFDKPFRKFIYKILLKN